MSRSLPRARRARSPLTVAATAAMLLAPIGALAAPTGASAAPGPLVLTGTNGGNLLGSAGDFNGDGKTDVLYRAYDTTVVVIFGASTPPVGVDPTLELGTRAISYRIPSGAALWGATAAGDVDHDGLGDIVVVTDKGDYVVYGTTAGAGTTTELAAGPGITAVTPRPLGSTFGATTVSNGQSPLSTTFALGDFNGDGYDDVELQGGAGASIVLGGPRVQTLNAGVQGPRVSLIDGTKSCSVQLVFFKSCSNAPVSGFAAGDFNGDGKDDLVFLTTTGGTPQLLLGRTAPFTIAAGATAASQVALPVAASPYAMPAIRSGVGDVNGDGLDDLAFGNGSIVLGRRSPGTSIASSDPSVIRLTSSKQGAISGSPDIESVALGDVDGDGRRDLLTTAPPSAPRVVTALPAAGGTLDVDTQAKVAGLPDGVGLVRSATDIDVDGDGGRDALLSDPNVTKTYVLTHQPAGTGGVVQPPSYPTSITQDGWQSRAGSVTQVGSGVRLTDNGPEWSAWSWHAPGDYRSKTVSFDVSMDAVKGGTGGEGMTLAFVTPTADGTFPAIPTVGLGGNTLGFEGFQGLAVGLDVLKGAGDPAANEVGYAYDTNGNGLRWYKTAPSPVPLYGSGPVHVTVRFRAGSSTVSINDKLVAGGGYTPPPNAFLTFTAATSTSPAYQATTVSNLVVSDT